MIPPKSIPALPVMRYTSDELRERLKDNHLALHLVDLVEAHQKREAFILEEARDLALACQDRRSIPASFVRNIAELLALELTHRGAVRL